MTLYIGGFSRVVAFPPAPIATGWSDPCREGLAPSQEPCLSTAHVSFVLSPAIGLFCHRHRRNCFHRLDTSVEMSGPHDFTVRIGIARLARRYVHRSPSLRP